jgi:hypothetical protein
MQFNYNENFQLVIEIHQFSDISYDIEKIIDFYYFVDTKSLQNRD